MAQSNILRTKTLNFAKELALKMQVFTVNPTKGIRNRIIDKQIYTHDEINVYRDSLKRGNNLGEKEIRVISEQGKSIKIAEGEGVTVTNKDNEVKELKVTNISNPQEIKGIDKNSQEQTFSRNDIVKYNLNNTQFGLENNPEKQLQITHCITRTTLYMAHKDIGKTIDNLASQMVSGNMEQINVDNKNVDLSQISDKENKVALVKHHSINQSHMNNKEFLQELSKFKEVIVVTNKKHNVEQTIQNTLYPSEFKLKDMTVHDAKTLIDTHNQAQNLEHFQE